MKKMFFIAAVVPALVFSCNKADQDNTVKETVLSFSVEDAITKTDLVEIKSLRWSAGDQFILMDTGFNWRQFTLKSGAGDVAATFSAPGDLSFAADATCFYGMYDGVKYPAYIGTAESDWDVTLPSEYDVDGSNIKVPLIAYLSETESLRKFKMVGGALKVDVYGIPATASSLVVTANRQIAGTMHMKGEVITVSGTSATDNEITFNFTPGVSQRSFCIPLPVCAEGYTLSLSFRNDSHVQVAHKSATIPAVTSRFIMYAPAFSLDATEAETIIWRGPKATGNYGANVDAFAYDNRSFWDNVKAGQTLTVYFEENEVEPAYQCLVIKDGQGWANIDGVGNEWGQVWTHGTGGNSWSIVMDAVKMLPLAKEKGLGFGGYYITITKITLK